MIFFSSFYCGIVVIAVLGDLKAVKEIFVLLPLPDTCQAENDNNRFIQMTTPSPLSDVNHSTNNSLIPLALQVRTLFVSGLPMDTKPRELYLLFRAYEVRMARM